MISWAEDFVTVFGPDLSIRSRGCVGGVVKNRTISTIWIGKKSIRLTNNPWKRTWNWIGLPKMCGLPNMHKDLRLMLWKPFLHSTYTKLWWASGTSNLKNIFEERKYHGIHSGGMWFTIRQDTSAILGPLATHKRTYYTFYWQFRRNVIHMRKLQFHIIISKWERQRNCIWQCPFYLVCCSFVPFTLLLLLLDFSAHISINNIYKNNNNRDDAYGKVRLLARITWQSMTCK